jgi:hypothetical protein
LGGGLYAGNGTFTMSGGTISGNSATYGGGLYVETYDGTFTMNGGTISGNTAGACGGGVFVYSRIYKFTKQSGGTIYGSDADIALKNTASGNGEGHAVYVRDSLLAPTKIRDTTAGPGVTLDSTVSGAAGGWE